MRRIVPLILLIVIPLLGAAQSEVQIVDRYEYAQVISARPAIERQQVEVQQTICQQRQLSEDGERTGSPAFDALEERLREFALEQVEPVEPAEQGKGRSREARICSTVNEFVWRDVFVGYDVRMLYKGKMYDVRTETDPGARLKLKVVLVPDE